MLAYCFWVTEWNLGRRILRTDRHRARSLPLSYSPEVIACKRGVLSDCTHYVVYRYLLFTDVLSVSESPYKQAKAGGVPPAAGFAFILPPVAAVCSDSRVLTTANNINARDHVSFPNHHPWYRRRGCRQSSEWNSTRFLDGLQPADGLAAYTTALRRKSTDLIKSLSARVLFSANSPATSTEDTSKLYSFVLGCSEPASHVNAFGKACDKRYSARSLAEDGGELWSIP